MTERSCKIVIKSTQVIAGEKEITTDSYLGRFVDRDSKKYLSYKRVTEDGTIDCLLSYGNGKVTMTQQGQISSKMEFQAGKHTNNPYKTPVGNMTLPVYTRSLVIDEKSGSISITVDYDINVGDPLGTHIEIEVELK